MKGLNHLFVLFNIVLVIEVFGFVRVAEAQKEGYRLVPPPKIDSVEIAVNKIPGLIIPQFLEEKLSPKIGRVTSMKCFLVTEEGNATNISTDYFEDGKKVLNIQILAKNSTAFKFTARYVGKNSKVVYATAEQTESFSNVFILHDMVRSTDLYEIQVPVIRWREEVQDRYKQYSYLFIK